MICGVGKRSDGGKRNRRRWELANRRSRRQRERNRREFRERGGNDEEGNIQGFYL